MKIQKLLAVTLVLVFTVILGCSSREDKAQTSFEQAQKLEQAGDAGQADQMYRRLIAEYPETPAGKQAEARVKEIAQQKRQAAETGVLQSLETARKVMDGYAAMYQRLPQSLADLDNGEYFFDSAYLADSLSQGQELYLAWNADGRGYQLWSLADGAGYAVHFDSVEDRTVKLKPADVQKALQDEFTLVTAKKGLKILDAKKG